MQHDRHHVPRARIVARRWNAAVVAAAALVGFWLGMTAPRTSPVTPPAPPPPVAGTALFGTTGDAAPAATA